MCGLAVEPGRLGREPVADSCHRSPETARGLQEGKGGGRGVASEQFFFSSNNRTTQKTIYTQERGGGGIVH